MKNGYHRHYCPKCKTKKLCAKVTHCNMADESVCRDCSLIQERAEENYCETGKWPGETK